MIALHESLVEGTALALGAAVAAAQLVRMRTARPRVSGRPRLWLAGVALLAIVANAGIAVNAAAAAAGQAAADGAAALRMGAIAASACLVALLVAWLYLSRSVRVLPSPGLDDDGGDCCADCPQCADTGLELPESLSRRRARGLTMTRIGGE